ncbi:hypothetical protein DENSPDRAFT_82103 [Dentipellis sp. KUC8613]|nr:hypothetical protein DENSPDRAFT_82103 [Dentipellis sp. KUC8613]
MANRPLSLSSVHRAAKPDEDLCLPVDILPVKSSYDDSPISRLPPEIIALIFKVLAAVHRESIYPFTWGQRGWHRLGWILVTHVCRYWRDIAIQNSSLWCEIDTGLDLLFLEEQLARSQSSPISWSIHSDTGPRQIALLSQHLFHIGNLSCSDVIYHPGEFAEKVLTRPAPLLRRLAISESIHLGQDEVLVTLPSDIFAGSTPSLRFLSIRGAQLPWLLPCLSNLVELKINAFNSAIFSTPSGSAPSPITGRPVPASSLLYHALPQLRSLRTLHLTACLPEATTERHEIVEMPFLEDLQLTGEITSCRQLINHIVMPHRCRLRLCCLLEPTASIADTDFLVPLLTRFAGPAKYALATSFSNKNVTLALHESPDDGDDAASMTLDQWCAPNFYSHFAISICCQDNAPQPPDWCTFTMLSKLSEGLSSANIHSLSILWVEPAFELYSRWHNAFKGFHKVKHLYVCHFSMVMLAIAWSPVVSDVWGLSLDQEPTEEDLRAFPHLVSLSLMVVTRDQDIYGYTFLAGLREALIERKNSGMALRRLALVNTKMEEHEVERLKELVPVVQWEKGDEL